MSQVHKVQCQSQHEAEELASLIRKQFRINVKTKTTYDQSKKQRISIVLFQCSHKQINCEKLLEQIRNDDQHEYRTNKQSEKSN